MYIAAFRLPDRLGVKVTVNWQQLPPGGTLVRANAAVSLDFITKVIFLAHSKPLS